MTYMLFSKQENKSKTGCSDCDKVQKETGNNTEMCPKCYLKYLKYEASKAYKAYLDELRNQSRKETK